MPNHPPRQIFLHSQVTLEHTHARPCAPSQHGRAVPPDIPAEAALMGSVMGPDVTAGTVLVAEAERGKKEN